MTQPNAPYGEPYFADGQSTIWHGDALEVLGHLRADVVILDPPYNADKDYASTDDNLPEAKYRAWIGRLLALSAGTASTVLWFPGVRNVWWAYEAMAESGLRVRRMLGWHKKEFAGDKFSGGPAMCWEPIFWMTDGEPIWNQTRGLMGRDFLVVNSTHGRPSYGHPCPKPIEVMRWLIAMFVPEGGTVLDPTMGIGTTLVAAKELGRKAIGIEIDEGYCLAALNRLAQEVLAL